jgi:protein-S-isoprenylcysteine O-methyltransferase Ste14
MKGYLLLVGFWILYGVMHSLFAARWMKNIFLRFMGGRYKYYRLIYSMLAAFMLIPILWYQSTLPQQMIFHQQAVTIFTGLSLAAIGIMVIKISFGHYDLKEFLGLHQLKGIQSKEPIQTGGILSKVRHPLYSGSILAILGNLIFAPTPTNLVMSFCLILYFIIGMHFEEKKLILEYGEQYREYRQQVPSLIPRWKKFPILVGILKKIKFFSGNSIF